MNNTERLCNIDDTTAYIANKVDTELRQIKALLRKILEKLDKEDRTKSDCYACNENDLTKSLKFS